MDLAWLTKLFRLYLELDIVSLTELLRLSLDSAQTLLEYLGGTLPMIRSDCLGVETFHMIAIAWIVSENIGMCKITHFCMVLCAILMPSVRYCQQNIRY